MIALQRLHTALKAIAQFIERIPAVMRHKTFLDSKSSAGDCVSVFTVVIFSFYYVVRVCPTPDSGRTEDA